MDLDVISHLPDDISKEDFMDLIKELTDRIENFDRNEAVTSEELLKEISQW